MAISNFAVTAPNLAQYSALSELKPLSFAGGMQSPLEFRTMSAIRPPDAQPEAVAQGIGQALGSLGDGITAAFKSKADDKKDALKFQRDKELARIKEQADADYRQQTLNETKRYHNILEARKEDVLPPNFGNTSYSGKEQGTNLPEPEAPATTENTETEKRTMFGSDPETKYMGRDANVTPEGVPLSMTEEQTKTLSGLTPDISEPSNRSMLTAGLSGALPYTGLSDLDAGKIFAQYNVSSSPLGIPNSAPIQKAYDLMLDEYRQDALTNTLAEQKQFGTLPLPEPRTPESATPALGNLKPVYDKVPRSTFNSYPEAQRYMEDQAGNPNWYASGTPEPNKQGKFVIPWKQNDPEIRASRKDKKGETLLQDQMKVLSNVENARNTLKDITERLAATDAGPIWGAVVGLNPYNATAVSVENMVTSLVPQLARGVFGEVGVLTDRDVERYKALIPNMKTDPKVAKTILDDLMRRLDKTKQINLDVWEKSGYNVSGFKESQKAEVSSLDVEKAKMEVSMAVKEMERAWGGANSKTAKDPEAYRQAIQKHKKALADYKIAQK
jgi:hypothetical protein